MMTERHVPGVPKVLKHGFSSALQLLLPIDLLIPHRLRAVRR